MIRTTLLACSILTFLPSIAMKRLCSYTKRSRPIKRLRIEHSIQLPLEIEQAIIREAIDNERQLRSCIKIIKTLALTSRKNYSQLSDQKHCDDIIQKLSQRFYCSHETVAKNLHTPAANKRLILQNKLFLLCCEKPFPYNYSEQCNLLMQKGAQANFTYNYKGQPQTLLMINCHLLSSIFFSTFNTFLNMSDFNTETSQKKTLLIKAVEYPISSSHVRQIIAYKKNKTYPFCTDINYKNKAGNTALLHCIKNRMSKPMTRVFVSVIAALLKYGANPLLADKYDKTALELVYDLPDLSELRDETIQLVKDAIEKWPSAQ